MMAETTAIQPARPQVALLGTGTMGAGMAQRLLDLGFPVTVWNRTPGPAAALAEHGATVRAQPTEAVADAEVVVTMLPDADAVADVMLRGGTLDALRPHATWAQMGTIGVEPTERLAADVARRRPEVVFVDAPVSGSREPARTGRLLVLASGPDRSHDAVDAVFAALGQRTLWLGPAGTASRLKLVVNAWLAFEIEAAAEAGALAGRLGVPYAVLTEAVSGGPLASATASTKLAKMESGDYSADFSLEWALKDLDLALAASGAETTPVVMAIAERWRRLVAQGLGRLDISAARLGLTTGPQRNDPDGHDSSPSTAHPSHADHRPPVGQDPATAPSPPTELGYLYPENDILAVVEDRTTGERALAALREAGVPDGDMDLLAGGWFVERMRTLRKRHGLLQLLGLSDERDLIQGYVEEAGNGHHLIAVHATEPTVVERVRRVLVAHGARHLLHWERFTVTDLSDEVPAGADDQASVARARRGAEPLDPCVEEIARYGLEAEQRDGFR
jgi:3-hydroxyisobutyrate dehydrogenase